MNEDISTMLVCEEDTREGTKMVKERRKRKRKEKDKRVRGQP